MSIEKPWALLRHHRGWADLFHIETETANNLTGAYPDRQTDEPVILNTYAVLARFDSLDEAKAARERGLTERRKHDAAVDAAKAALDAAEKAQEEAWLSALKGA